jgi:hypothetical protein
MIRITGARHPDLLIMQVFRPWGNLRQSQSAKRGSALQGQGARLLPHAAMVRRVTRQMFS